MTGAVRRIVAATLAPDPWAPFGWLPVADTDPGDGRSRLRFDDDDPHLNVIAHHRGELEAVNGASRCAELYRHARHTQALMVLNCSAVVAVAPAEATFSEPADSGRIRAFLLRPLDAFVLHAGTWHWGPYPLDDVPVQLLNVQSLSYRDDNDRTDLARCGAVVDVVASP